MTLFLLWTRRLRLPRVPASSSSIVVAQVIVAVTRASDGVVRRWNSGRRYVTRVHFPCADALTRSGARAGAPSE